jgi:hypothetical protein
MKKTTTTKEMTVEEIRTASAHAGFIPVTYNRGDDVFIKTASCKRCKSGKMLVFRAKEKGGTYHTARACTCGYREFFGWGYDKSTTTTKDKKPTNPEASICKSEGCNNTLPKGRTAYCHSCRPPKTKPSKKEAQSGTAY